MTNEPKAEPRLLTEEEWRKAIKGAECVEIAIVGSRLRKRGLIAAEPVDALLVEAREIAATMDEAENGSDSAYARRCREGKNDDQFSVLCALAALKRGMDLARVTIASDEGEG